MDKPIAPILIVDDEPSVLSALKRELRDTAPVFTAQNAQEAIKILETNTVGVIVSDYKMPNKDGVTFLSGLKDLPYEPVKILMTAFSDPDIAIDAINRAGVYYFLKKPWNSNELTLLMERALEAYKNKNELKFCKQRLREIENIKDNITSLLTHELKTPLTTISGYTEILCREINNTELKAVINSLQNSVTRLEGFIDETLYIAKIEARQVNIHSDNIELKNTIEKVFPFIDIKEAVTIVSDKKLVEESLDRLSRYLFQQGGKLTGEYSKSGNYLVLKFFVDQRDHKTIGTSQLGLFQRMETNTDVMHYGSEASLDVIFASTVFNALNIGFNVIEMDNKLRVEIIFNTTN